MTMGDSFYIVRSKEKDKVIDMLVRKYGLALRYQNQKEQIFSGEEMLISRQKGYTFLRLLSNCPAIALEVKNSLQL